MSDTITPRATKNLDGYGGEPLTWDRALGALTSEWMQQGPSGDGLPHTHWLATSRADGKPHVVPVGAAWLEGRFHFTSGRARRSPPISPTTRDARSRSPRAGSTSWSKVRRPSSRTMRSCRR